MKLRLVHSSVSEWCVDKAKPGLRILRECTILPELNFSHRENSCYYENLPMEGTGIVSKVQSFWGSNSQKGD
jgi:hypothetical protein